MNIIGIYPGPFQPPTVGNYRAYEYLKKHTGSNTFVTTSDVVDLPASPLSFQDKQQIWTRHGVPIDKVVLSKDPNKAVEITKKFGADRTVVVFGMTPKNAQLALKSSSGYFLPFKGIAQSTEPLNKRAYILIIPDEISKVSVSKMAVSGNTIRRALNSTELTEEQKKSFFKQVFGWYDISLFDLIKKKFMESNTVRERVNENYSLPIVRRTLKAFVKEVLGQLSTPSQAGIDVDPSVIDKQEKIAKQTIVDREKAAKAKLRDDKKIRDAEKKSSQLKMTAQNQQIHDREQEIRSIEREKQL